MNDLINSLAEFSILEMYNPKTFWGFFNLGSITIVIYIIISALYVDDVEKFYNQYEKDFKKNTVHTIDDKVNLNPIVPSDSNKNNSILYKKWLIAKFWIKGHSIVSDSFLWIFLVFYMLIGIFSQIMFYISDGGNFTLNEEKVNTYVLKNGEDIIYSVIKAEEGSRFDIKINTDGKVYDYKIDSNLVKIDSNVSKSTLKAVVLKDIKELEDTVVDYMITEDLGIIVPQSLVIGSDVIPTMYENNNTE